MRDFALFYEHLERLHKEKLDSCYRKTLGREPEYAMVAAHQAEMLMRLMKDLKELEHDSGEFIHKYLQ